MSEFRVKILAEQPSYNGSYEDHKLKETQLLLNHIKHGETAFSAADFMATLR